MTYIRACTINVVQGFLYIYPFQEFDGEGN